MRNQFFEVRQHLGQRTLSFVETDELITIFLIQFHLKLQAVHTEMTGYKRTSI